MNDTDLKKPDYKNWVPPHMIIGACCGFAACLAAFSGLLFFGRSMGDRLRKILLWVTGILSVIFGCFSVLCIAWHRAFDYNGKRRMAAGIIEGTAAHINLPEGGKILDVGCGSGALAIACARRNPKAEVIGIDRWGAEYSIFSRELCEKNAAAEGVRNTSFRKGDACCLDFADETFDAVTSNYVYHNIGGTDKQQLLLETLRVLKKGGVFAIHDIMSPARYGDMEAFRTDLKARGYADVDLIPTDNGLFMSRAEGLFLGLSGSTLLVGRK